MKLTSRVGGYTVEVEGNDAEELFRNTAEMQELLSFGSKCGKTGNPDVIMRVRKSGDYEFLSMSVLKQALHYSLVGLSRVVSIPRGSISPVMAGYLMAAGLRGRNVRKLTRA